MIRAHISVFKSGTRGANLITGLRFHVRTPPRYVGETLSGVLRV